jgi:hypothetical protein
MKQRSFWSAVILSTISATGFAQTDSSGIYRTAQDFQQGRLSYAINYKTEKHKVKDDLLFRPSEIKVKHDGQIYSFKKSAIYGYRDTKGVNYRFLGNNALKILNKGEGLLLYNFLSSTSPSKGGHINVTEYYFSKDAGSMPVALTKENLKAAFPDNHKFHDALDAAFKDDQELDAYDSFHKMYKVNHVLAANQ